MKSLGLLLACFPLAFPVAADRLVVAVTVAPQAYLVERLAGDAVEVLVMVPAGAGGEAEHYSPTPSQMRALERCRLYFKVGHRAFSLETVHVEPFLASHREIRPVSLAGAERDSLPGDPHLWLSPRRMARATGELAQALGELLPARRAAITSRAAELAAEIAELDGELGRRFAAAAEKTFFVNHGSLGYFARDYGLIQRALEYHGREPTASRLRRLTTELRQRRVPVVLVQDGFSRAAAEILARDAALELRGFDPLERDWLAATRRLGDAVAAALAREPGP